MDYLGNKELLKLPKTAFLASSTIPTDMVLKCYDWATQMAKEGRCVVSGFSSHLEKEVLHFLMKGRCPIILVLARQMYKQIPQELQTLLDENRLLVISTSNAVRQSRVTALARNRHICEMADQILFIGVTEKSSLYSLKEKYANKLINLECQGTGTLTSKAEDLKRISDHYHLGLKIEEGKPE
jgi:predicted Rossmann fold nucleotide-binding protein DprA/Smf involved in DNA uptake